MFKIIDWKEIPLTEQELLELKEREKQHLIDLEKMKLEEDKQIKSEAIQKVATLSDQLNLIASVLDTLTSDTPDTLIIADAKAKFAEIKTILNS